MIKCKYFEQSYILLSVDGKWRGFMDNVYFFSKALKEGFNIESICIQTKDNVIFEGSDAIVNVHSVAKTITSLALGLLLQEHEEIHLYDKVVSFFPEYKDCYSKNTNYIEIRDLLHMSSGKSIQSLLQPNNNAKWNEDWVKWFLEYPMNSLPGNVYYYSSHCCYMIGRIIERVSNEDVNDYLLYRLWEPLKISKPYWGKCPHGYTNCAGDLMMKCSDLSKIGWLILNKGLYDSVQIDISENYMEKMCFDVVNSSDPFRWNDEECNAGYGYFIWKCKEKGKYRIWGAGGNFSVIDFLLHKCVTVTAVRDDLNWRFYNEQNLLRLIIEYFF